MPGFDYTFVREVPAEFSCPICVCTMREPVQTKCGHRFCKQCLEQSMEKSKECPTDRHPLDQQLTGDVYPDVAIERTILDLKVKCPNKKIGCQWIGELRAVQAHVDFCKKCPCCCPQKCGKNNIPREKLKSHVKDHCSLTKVDCTYAHVGCKEKVARKDLSRHLKNDMEIHLSLACSMVHNHRQQITPKYIWKFDQFAQRRELAKNGREKKYVSPPFSTGPRGYRMQMVVFPDGDGLGNHTHLSVFAEIIQGKYDAILTWPFKLDVTFTLIDQQADPNKRQNVHSSLAANATRHLPENTFTRPSTALPNSLFGFPKFIPQETLQTRSYVVDDVLFFQLEVDLLDSVV